MTDAKNWELRSFEIALVFTLALPQVQTFVSFCNLEEIVNRIETGQTVEVLWNLYWDFATIYS